MDSLQNKDDWSESDDKLQKRSVEDMDITEVSIIDDKMSPIYFGTSIEKRGTEEAVSETRQEDFRAIIENTNSEKRIKLIKIIIKI